MNPPFLVVVKEDPLSGCWECVSHKPGVNGYPLVKVEGRAVALHRFMFVRHNPGITPQVVRHTCDNPLCVRPEHLVAGTHADNVHDRVTRGRSAKGSRHGRTKLTPEQVRSIRSDTTSTNAALGERYGVDPTTIRAIRSGKTWKEVA